MSIDFAIVHESTHEAYELGVEHWDPWVDAMPLSIKEVRELVESLFSSPDDAGYRNRLVREIWSFIESHPGCSVVDDTGTFWSVDPDASDVRAWGSRVFRQIGSRYNHEHFLLAAETAARLRQFFAEATASIDVARVPSLPLDSPTFMGPMVDGVVTPVPFTDDGLRELEEDFRSWLDRVAPGLFAVTLAEESPEVRVDTGLGQRAVWYVRARLCTSSIDARKA